MKSLTEIGFIKALKFVYYTIALFLFDFMLFPPLRTLFLKLHGARIGKNSVIHNVKFFNLYHTGFSNLIIGDNCFLGNEVMIDLAGKVILEDHVTVSNRAFILTHTNVGYKNHPLQKHIAKVTLKVHLKRGCFIGVGSIIFPGIIVGRKAVVGAGSVVTKNIPDKTIVVGSPAKIIKKITN